MNSEEIYLDEEMDTDSGPFITVIPNAQDVQVAAAAALSGFDSESESVSDESVGTDEFEQESEEQDDEVMTEFVSLSIKIGSDVQDAPHVHVELRSVPAKPIAVDQILDEESEETSSDEDEVEEIATYGELKSMLDNMTSKECSDAPAPVPTAAELLFTDSMHQLDTLVIEENDAVSLAGHVISRLEGTVVVRASKDSQVLDEGSILVTHGKQLLGPVEDIFGPVQMPMYILRDPSAAEDCGTVAVDIGEAVYSVDKLAKPVAEEELLRVKGYDSDDVEGQDNKPDVECEFSDDEAEAAYRRSLKSKRKGTVNKTGNHASQRPQRRPGRTRQHHDHGHTTAPSTRPQYQPMYLADHPAMQNQFHFKQSDANGHHQGTFVPITFEPRHAFGDGGGGTRKQHQRPGGSSSSLKPFPPN